jgi:hypothetical protein
MRLTTYAIILSMMALHHVMTAWKLAYLLGMMLGETAPFIAVTLAGTEIAIIVIKSTKRISIPVHLWLSFTSGLFHLLVAIAVYLSVIGHGAADRLSASVESIHQVANVAPETSLFILAILIAVTDCAVTLTLTTLLSILLKDE